MFLLKQEQFCDSHSKSSNEDHFCINKISLAKYICNMWRMKSLTCVMCTCFFLHHLWRDYNHVHSFLCAYTVLFSANMRVPHSAGLCSQAGRSWHRACAVSGLGPVTLSCWENAFRNPFESKKIDRISTCFLCWPFVTQTGSSLYWANNLHCCN